MFWVFWTFIRTWRLINGESARFRFSTNDSPQHPEAQQSSCFIQQQRFIHSMSHSKYQIQYSTHTLELGFSPIQNKLWVNRHNEWPTALRLGGTSGRRLKIHFNKGLSTRRSNKPFELCLAFLIVCCSVGRGWAKPQGLTSCLPCCASLLCNETERLGAPLNTDFKFRFRALGSSQPKPSRKTKHPAAVHQVTV